MENQILGNLFENDLVFTVYMFEDVCSSCILYCKFFSSEQSLYSPTDISLLSVLLPFDILLLFAFNKNSTLPASVSY